VIGVDREAIKRPHETDQLRFDSPKGLLEVCVVVDEHPNPSVIDINDVESRVKGVRASH
jgi:hypothetical protein